MSKPKSRKAKKPTSYSNRKAIQQIQKKQEFAKGFMLGGAMIPIFEGDGSTHQTMFSEFVSQLDIFKIENDEQGLARKVTYHYPNEKVLEALFSIKHKWTLGYAIVCRDKRGKVYFVQERYLVTNQFCEFNDIEAHLEKMITAFNAANEQYRLGIVYCFLPDNQQEIYQLHFNAITYVRNILGKMHTKYEYENTKEIHYYYAETMNDYLVWFYNQKATQNNRSVPIENTTSYYNPNVEKVSASLSQLHPIPDIIPIRYFKQGLQRASNIPFDSNVDLKECFEVNSQESFERYKIILKQYLKNE